MHARSLVPLKKKPTQQKPVNWDQEWKIGVTQQKQLLEAEHHRQMCKCKRRAKSIHEFTCDWYVLSLPHVILWEIGSYLQEFHDDATLQSAWYKCHVEEILRPSHDTQTCYGKK